MRFELTQLFFFSKIKKPVDYHVLFTAVQIIILIKIHFFTENNGISAPHFLIKNVINSHFKLFMGSNSFQTIWNLSTFNRIL